jgi:hypothetical protein
MFLLPVEVNEDKTYRADLSRGESFGFLGFEFRRVRSRSGRWLDAIVSAPDKETHGIAAPAQGYFPGLALPTGHTGYRND